MNTVCNKMKISDMKSFYGADIRDALKPNEVMNFPCYVTSTKLKKSYNKVLSNLTKGTAKCQDLLSKEEIKKIFFECFPRIILSGPAAKTRTIADKRFESILSDYERLSGRYLENLSGANVEETLTDEGSPIVSCPDILGEDFLCYVMTTQQWKSKGTTILKKLLVDYCIADKIGRNLTSVAVFYSDVGEMKKHYLGNWDYTSFMEYFCSLVPCDITSLTGAGISSTYLISACLSRLDYTIETLNHRTPDWQLAEAFGRFSCDKDVTKLLESVKDAKDRGFVEHFADTIKDTRHFSISMNGIALGKEMKPSEVIREQDAMFSQPWNQDTPNLDTPNYPQYSQGQGNYQTEYQKGETAVIYNQGAAEVALSRKHFGVDPRKVYILSGVDITKDRYTMAQEIDELISNCIQYQQMGVSGMIFDIKVLSPDDMKYIGENLYFIHSHIDQSDHFDLFVRVPSVADATYVKLDDVFNDLSVLKPSTPFKICVDAENALSHGVYPMVCIYSILGLLPIGLVWVHPFTLQADDVKMFCTDNGIPVAFK